MVKRVVITNYRGESVEYKIEGVDVFKNNGLLITEIEGLGPAGADIIFTKLVSTDGSLFNTSRLTERNIVIHAKFTWAKTTEEARLSSYRYFPLGKRVRIQVDTDNRKVYTYGYVEKNEPNIFQSDTDVMISILCESPFFTDANGETTSVALSNIIPLFEFQYENVGLTPNTEISQYIQRNNSIWTYAGESEIGFSLIIHAIGIDIWDRSGDIPKVVDVDPDPNNPKYRIENPTIHFITSGGSITFDTDLLEERTGNKFYNGDDIILTSMPTKKRIQYRHQGELIDVTSSFITSDMNWPTLYPGPNGFAFTATEGEEYIRMYLQYTAMYEGV